MTNNRAKALSALEKTIDLVDHDSDEPIPTPFKNFLSAEVYKTIKEALSEPKWKTMDDIRAYDGQEIDILLNGNARIPNVYFDDDLQQFLTAGTDVPVIIDGDPINEITHWMHLPDAPTGEKS